LRRVLVFLLIIGYVHYRIAVPVDVVVAYGTRCTDHTHNRDPGLTRVLLVYVANAYVPADRIFSGKHKARHLIIDHRDRGRALAVAVINRPPAQQWDSK